MKQTGGRWDPKGWPVYFAAADLGTLSICFPPGATYKSHILIAVNELRGEGATEVAALAAGGVNVLVDSGVYWLSTQHAQKHNMTMNAALSMAPDEVDGFDELFEAYVEIGKTCGDSVWGMIEIDQGGRENKIKTRKRLEKMGLRPIPVYHPLNDGWEYFDYLAQRYDRICFGNVVMAEPEARKRLLATAWERRRKYPDLWIHMLGLTPSRLTIAMPINSCDSSTWISGIRWGYHKSFVAADPFDELPSDFVYDLEESEDALRGRSKARLMCGYDAVMLNRTMRNIAEEQKRCLGVDIGLFK